MTENLKGIIIRPAIGFGRMTDEVFLGECNAVNKGMDGNPSYTKSPVSMTDFKGRIDEYTTSMAAAHDGGKTAIADKKKKRQNLTVMMLALAHYVSLECKGDLTTFLSSGFVPRSSNRTPAQPLDQPTVAGVEQGTTGQALVMINGVKKARKYEVECIAAGSTSPLPVVSAPSAKSAVAVDGLTPGVMYSFRVRAYGQLGNTDWSTPVSRMCI